MYIEGRNAVLESLRSQRQFKKLWVQDGVKKDTKVKQIISKAKNRNIHIIYISRKKLDSISPTGVHQGFIAQVKAMEELSFTDHIDKLYQAGVAPFFVYIRDAQYDYNVGAIIRTAECSGVNGVILPPKIDMSAEIVRASTGASEHIPIFHESLFTAIKIAEKNAIKVAGIEISGKKYYYQEDLTGAIMLIIGGEDHPLSVAILKKCDIIVKIPLLGRINSLNMSVAASIVTYDKLRQEHIS